MSFLFYKRPDFLSKPKGPISTTDCAIYVQRAKGVERSIPDGLSFEDVVNGKSMAPCSLNEFMDYLVYVEHNAENLQFYLWYQDYVKRFNALPESQKALSPEWTSDSDAPIFGKDQEDYGSPSEYGILRSPSKATLMKTGYGSSTKSFGEDIDEATLPKHPKHKTKASISSIAPSFVSRKSTSTRNNTKASPPWQPFSIQPMRDEITQLTHYYLIFSAPRELNLSHRDRAAVLHTLQHTTHPSALFPALQITESTLRGQAHPNFIRWSICNGNKPRVFLIRSVGICNTILGFLLATLLTLSNQTRWLRITAAVPWLLGITNMVAAYNGLCILLHNAHVRNLRPWEEDLHDLEASEAARRSDDSIRAEIQMSSRMKIGDDRDAENTFIKSSMRTFGGKNHWDGEWLERYEKKSWWQRAKGKKVWTQDQAMRFLQDRIVLSANIWGLILTVILCAGFVAMPKGNYY